MTDELLFRVAFSALWIIFFGVVIWISYSTKESRDKETTRRASQLRGATVVLAIIYFAGASLYALIPGWVMFFSILSPDWFRLVMVGAAVLGILLVSRGYLALGKNWAPSVSGVRKDTVLVTNGLYGFVRHPIYLGAFIFLVALSVVAANLVILLPTLALLTLLYTSIDEEEGMLIDRFGDEYREYMKRTPRIIPRLRQKHLRGWDDREVNIDVFRNPSKYLKRLPIGEIVADSRVYRRGVERYKERIARGESVPPIIVVKHPSKEMYAVLDGHHRYYAYVELGRKEIDCAVAGNASGVVFYLTEHGVFQPPSHVTEHIRVPAFEFNAKVKEFLSAFSNDPHEEINERLHWKSESVDSPQNSG